MSRLALLALSLLAMALPAHAADWSVAGSIDRRVVSVGEPLEYTLVIRGKGAREAQVQEPDWGAAGLQRVSQSSSYSTKMNIGSGGTQVNSEQTYAYTLVAQREGTWEIGSFNVTVKGLSQRTVPIRLVIKPVGTITPGQAEADFWVEAKASAQEVYAGQQVHVVYTFVTRKQVRDLNFPVQPDFSGYWVEDHSPGQISGQQEVRDGVSYTTAVLRDLYLFPIHAGEMQVPAITVQAGVALQQRPQRGGLFEMFSQQGSRVQTVASPVLRLSVLPLPEEGRPADFSGAVGQFNLESQLDRTSVKAGEAITLTLGLTGTGHPNSFPEPKLSLPPAFEVYPPESQVQMAVQNSQLLGMKTWRYLLVGRDSGKQVISPASFSYFDSQEKRYRVLESKPVEVTIEGAPGAPPRKPVAASGRPSFNDSEIHFIKPNRTTLESAPSSAWKSPLFWGLQGTPWLALAGVVYWRRRRERLNSEAGAMTRSQAARNARKRLKAINVKKPPAEALGEVERAVFDYLADRSGSPVQGLTRSELSARLEAQGLPAQRVRELAAWLDRMEMLRYAGSGGDAQAERDKGLQWIESAEKEWP